MGFFTKKDQQRDGEFPQLTLKQGVKMRQLCEDAFVNLGISVKVLPDRVLVVDSTRGYGLETVARMAAEAPEREWKNAIAEYFGRVVAEGERVDIDELPVEQLNIRAFGVHLSCVWGPVGGARSSGLGCR